MIASLGNNIILSNNVMLAGHVTVEDRAILGGGSAVHQFTRIGRQAFIGGLVGRLPTMSFPMAC